MDDSPQNSVVIRSGVSDSSRRLSALCCHGRPAREWCITRLIVAEGAEPLSRVARPISRRGASDLTSGHSRFGLRPRPRPMTPECFGCLPVINRIYRAPNKTCTGPGRGRRVRTLTSASNCCAALIWDRSLKMLHSWGNSGSFLSIKGWSKRLECFKFHLTQESRMALIWESEGSIANYIFQKCYCKLIPNVCLPLLTSMLITLIKSINNGIKLYRLLPWVVFRRMLTSSSY